MKTLFGILLALASIQGFILGGIITQKGEQQTRRARKTLAVLLIVLGYVLLAESLRVFGVLSNDTALYYIFLEIDWAIGPLLYLFIRRLIRPDIAGSTRDAWLFLPLLIQVGLSAFIKIQNVFWDGTQDSLSWAGYEGYRLWMHTPFIFIVSSVLVLYFVHRARNLVRQPSPEASIEPAAQKDLNTILNVYLAFAIVVIAITVTDFLFFDYAFNPWYVYPVFIGLAALTYWLALSGVMNRDRRILRKKPVFKPEWRELVESLDASMHEQRWFLDPMLDSKILGSHMGVKAYRISKALNSVRGITVVQYINSFRVNEFVRRLGTEESQQLTLLAIALDCGFNSKASANRIIKQVTGKSPSDLKAEISAK